MKKSIKAIPHPTQPGVVTLEVWMGSQGAKAHMTCEGARALALELLEASGVLPEALELMRLAAALEES